MPQILIVDDEPNIASSLALLLQRHGDQTTVHCTGADALASVTGSQPDLVLLDLNLGDPLLDGLTVCQKIRALPVYLPVIMLTARGDSTDRVVGLEIGAGDYIAKPFDERELLARMRATL